MPGAAEIASYRCLPLSIEPPPAADGDDAPPPADSQVPNPADLVTGCYLLSGSAVRASHRAVVERLVERLVVDPRGSRDLTERAARGDGRLHDLGRLVVADVRVQRRRRR